MGQLPGGKGIKSGVTCLHEKVSGVHKACLKSTPHLESRLAYLVKSSERSVDKLYELAWGCFALKELGKKYRHFLVNIRSAVSVISSSSNLKGILYDYRRAVGLSLAIYLFGLREIGFPKERLDELCGVLTQISKDSGLGELIGASLLLIKHLKKKEFEKELESLLLEVKKSCRERPAYHLTDMLYVMFFTAIMREDDFLIEALEYIRRNELLMEYVNEDPERMALLLYALSRVAYLKSGEAELVKWCRNEMKRIAPELYHALEERRLLDQQNYVELIEALLDVAEGFDEQVRQKFGSLIRRGKNDEIIINKKVITPLSRLDLIAKAYIALSEAGYIRPFVLSKKEMEIYRQLQAEIKGYRRIRKYELFMIMITSISFIYLILYKILMSIKVTPSLNGLLVSLAIPIFLIYWQIWKSGQISSREMSEEFCKIIHSLIETLKR